MSPPGSSRSMETAIEQIMGRTMTQDERTMFSRLRDQWGYTDDDPLAVVIALFGGMTILTNDIPERIKQAATAMTEIHASVLRDQANLIAKDLVANVAEAVYASGRTRMRRIVEGAACFLSGALLTGLGFAWFVFK